MVAEERWSLTRGGRKGRFDCKIFGLKDGFKNAQPPNIIHQLKSDFNFTTQQFIEIFSLPHFVALESYFLKAFQYKVINSILYTNSKLRKVGFRIHDACTLCAI